MTDEPNDSDPEPNPRPDSHVHPDLPDDWIPLGRIEATSTGSPEGGIYLDTSGNTLSLIQVHDDKPNDLIGLWDSQIPDLIHRLVDYLDDHS